MKKAQKNKSRGGTCNLNLLNQAGRKEGTIDFVVGERNVGGGDTVEFGEISSRLDHAI